MKAILYRVFTLLIAITLSVSLEASPELSLKKVVLRTDDVTKLAEWYIEQLQFNLEVNTENKIVLTKMSFELELIEQENAIRLDNVKLKDGKNRMTGIYKYGFAVNNLDSLFEYVSAKELQTRGGIINDSQAGMKSFILVDPDNNYIQFFEKKGRLENLQNKPDWYPSFLMIYTDDFKSSFEWYGKLDFKEVSNYDNSARDIFQRSIFNGELLIELVQYQARVANKPDYMQIAERLVGITAIGCASDITDDSITDASGNVIEIIHKD